MTVTTHPPQDPPAAAGLPEAEVERWQRARPAVPQPQAAAAEELPDLAQQAARYFELGQALLDRLPARPRRDEPEEEAAAGLRREMRDLRAAFLRAFGEVIYARLTEDYTRYLRVEELVYRAAEAYPGLVPTRGQVAAETERKLRDKEGLEIDHGLFVSQILHHPRPGQHLLHAMRRPREESLERLQAFRREGRLDLGTAVVERRGKAGYLWFSNLRYLNAEDDGTAEVDETAVDLILLDPEIEVGVMRGARVDHPRYKGRHVFSAGLNLTHLYHGQLSFLFYLTRDLGFVNKVYRGLSGPEFQPDQLEEGEEKPWIAAVEAFAIGGGCQLLLVVDHVIAETGSYFNLPARKEGIIPGVSNMRLPRLVGDRLARQGIMFGRSFPADSPAGQLIADRVVERGEVGRAVEEAVQTLTGSGMVSAAGNRKAIRVGQEPADLYRRYMAVYAREQAYCQFSPALVRNLEEYWRAHERQL